MRRTFSALCVAVALAAVGALAAAVLVPRLAGATPYAVLTGSMEPGLPPGTLVVVRPVPPTAVQVGDVITYQRTSGRPDVVTHRVVARGVALDGRTVLRTQGDANASPDRAWVEPVQVRGELWYAVPVLGRLHTWLNGRQHAQLVRLAAAGLGVHALLMLGAALRGVRERQVSRALA